MNGGSRRRQLIDRKHELQAQIRSLRSTTERARREASSRPERARAARLQRKLNTLLEHEARLRLEIDRTS